MKKLLSLLLVIAISAFSFASEPCEEGAFVPDPNECGAFYKCVNGVWYALDCPAGLHWNAALQVCDWPENADCDGVGGAPTCPGSTKRVSAAKHVYEPGHYTLLCNTSGSYYCCI